MIGPIIPIAIGIAVIADGRKKSHPAAAMFDRTLASAEAAFPAVIDDASEDQTSLRAEAADPGTTAARLAEIAYLHPGTRTSVAMNANAYPGLIEWLRALNDPNINAAIDSRAHGETSTVP